MTLLLALTPAAAGALAQSVIYVDADVTGANDGTSWRDAFVNLQDALAVAIAGNEVWVAEGTHYPDRGSDRTRGDRFQSFVVLPEVNLFGGFSGIEDSVSSRSGGRTVLSGDLLENDAGEIAPNNPTRSDNSIHVVRIDSVHSGIEIDGFVITGGNANLSRREGTGGGMFALTDGPLTLKNVHFTANTATGNGGGFSVGGIGSLQLSDALFRFNTAYWDGGGLAIGLGVTFISNTAFEDNRARRRGGGMSILRNPSIHSIQGSVLIGNEAGWGGGMSVAYSSVNIFNTTFLGNSAADKGGAVGVVYSPDILMANLVLSGNHAERLGGALDLVENDKTTIVNSTLSLNTAGQGGSAINNYYGGLELYNSIVWGGPSAEQLSLSGYTPVPIGHSILDGGLPDFSEDAGGNRFPDPRFLSPAGADNIPGTLDDNLRLSVESPAIDAGSPDYLPQDVLDLDSDGDISEVLPVDLLGSDRSVNPYSGGDGIPDAGAYEVYRIMTGADRPELPAVEDELTLYPSPASTRVTALLSEPLCRGSVLVFDSLGRQLLRQKVSGCTESLEVDTRSLPQGIYLLTVDGGRTIHSSSLVIVK